MTFESELTNILNRQRQQGYCSLDEQIYEIKQVVEKYYIPKSDRLTFI